MKLSTIYTVFIVLLLAVLSLSNRNGRAGNQNWGNTGAPGDETLSNGQSRTCVTCHNTSSAVQVTLAIEIKDEMGNSITDNGYVPGEIYDVKVSINAAVGTPAGYGFQMLALNAEEGVDAAEVSTWTNLGSNVKSSFASNTNRTYVEHNGMSTTNEFMMKWMAPADLSGPVTFYAAGNGVNDNRSTTGDGAAVKRLTITQDITSSTQGLQHRELSVFPNPAKNELFLETRSVGSYELSIYDLSGRLMHQGKIDLGGQGMISQIDLSQLSSGTYFLQIFNDQEQLTKRIIKQ